MYNPSHLNLRPSLFIHTLAPLDLDQCHCLPDTCGTLGLLDQPLLKTLTATLESEGEERKTLRGGLLCRLHRSVTQPLPELFFFCTE